MTDTVQTDRLLLERPHRKHLAAYAAYCASDRARFVGGPFDAVKAFDKFCAMAGHWTLRGFGRLIVVQKATGAPIGHVGALQMAENDLPEMTWSLWTDRAERQGHAFEAAQAYLAQVSPDICPARMLARIHKDNARSHALALRLGAQLDRDATPPPWLPDALTYRLDRP